MGDKIEAGDAQLAAIGMGYVGLPLAVELVKGGVDTTGIDVSPEKVTQINAGQGCVGDAPVSDGPPCPGRNLSSKMWA